MLDRNDRNNTQQTTKYTQPTSPITATIYLQTNETIHSTEQHNQLNDRTILQNIVSKKDPKNQKK